MTRYFVVIIYQGVLAQDQEGSLSWKHDFLLEYKGLSFLNISTIDIISPIYPEISIQIDVISPRFPHSVSAFPQCISGFPQDLQKKSASGGIPFVFP